MIDDVIQRPLFLSVNRGPQLMDMILKIRQVCEMKPSEETEKQAKGMKTGTISANVSEAQV